MWKNYGIRYLKIWILHATFGCLFLFERVSILKLWDKMIKMCHGNREQGFMHESL